MIILSLFQIIRRHHLWRRRIFFSSRRHFHLEEVKLGVYPEVYLRRFRPCFSKSRTRHYSGWRRSPLSLGPTPLDPHRYFSPPKP